MSTANELCAGCQNVISNRLFMACSLCKAKYDIDCANISEKLFRLMDKNNKQKWTCQACKNRQPKTDNQNTPIRTQTLCTEDVDSEDDAEVSDCSERCNVTRRTKPATQRASCKQPASIEDIGELIDRKLSPTSRIMNGLRAVLRDDIKAMITVELNSVIAQLKDDFTKTTDFLSAEHKDLKEKLDKKIKEIDELQNYKQQIQRDVQALNSRLVTLEKMSRDKNLEIHGLQENTKENLLHMFKSFCKSVNVNIPDNEIYTCRRVAKLDQTTNRPRNVLVTLSSSRTRDYVLESVAKFNKGQKEKLNSSHFGLCGTIGNVYISEHISLECKKLFKEARKVGKNKNYKFIWVKRGNIYVRKTENTMAILIKSESCLSTLA